VLTLILIVLAAEYTPLSEMMLLHGELSDISIRRLQCDADAMVSM